jgi:predicted anti-sigma-YlaC factor YlaD
MTETSSTEGPMRGIEIPCAQIVEIVTDYLDRAMSAEQQRLVDEHLADCPPCTQYFEQIRTTIDLVGSVEESALSADAWEELRTAFRQRP